MLITTFKLNSTNGTHLHITQWMPASEAEIRAVIQIAHGMTETGSRYTRFAEALTATGFAVYANDHLGHGQTAANDSELGHLGKGDMMNMVEDMARLSQHIKEQHPHAPIILFGHSMGSFLAQMYMSLYGSLLGGVVLCGSNGPRGPELQAGIAMTRLIAASNGWKHRSNLITNMTFGGFNRRFKPQKTHYDWLSRDEAEVQKYIDDPYCGYICSVGFYNEFFKLLSHIHKPDVINKIPKDLPILLIAGSMDPVGNFGKGVPRLKEIYNNLGITDVSIIMYSDARHELLNDINRDEVTADCIDWFKRITDSR